MQMTASRWQRVLTALALATAGVVVGANLATTRQAHGEISAAPEIPAFQAGDQISVPILREISTTLRQIDGRLARLETAAQKMQAGSARGALSVKHPAGDAN